MIATLLTLVLAVAPTEPAEPAPEPSPALAAEPTAEAGAEAAEAGAEAAEAGAEAADTAASPAESAAQDPEPAATSPSETAPVSDPGTVEPPTEGPRAPDPEEQGPPYYSEDDIDALRARYEIPEDPRVEPRKPKWRCLIPDPMCGFGVELSATSAYVYRTRQGNISIDGSFFEWNSARVAYDLWFNFPAHTQTIGTYKFTRLTLGPKLSVVASDNEDLWANMGIALRYWFGVGKWSPALEFTSALSFKLAGQNDGLIETERSPVGLSADIGLNIGGWGALIVGGQYDSPLAREEIPEKFRVSAAGQLFVGFRGNILWGAPAAASVATHIALQRGAPPQP